MTDKLHKTKGIVLRAVKFGETSLVVLMLTEKFGIQSYLVNGVRVSTKKGAGKANFFQPSAILDLVAYHNELKQLQRLKEFKWSQLYRNIFSDVKKNTVALFMAELLTRALKQPEAHHELFQFTENAFLQLDESCEKVTANFPLYYSLRLAALLGFRLNNNYSAQFPFFDLQDGNFVNERPPHSDFLEKEQAEITSLLLNVSQPGELEDYKLNHNFRRNLLQAIETYYALHIQDFGSLKSLPVLREILS